MLHLWRELNNIIAQINAIVNQANTIDNVITDIVADAPLNVSIVDHTATISLNYDTNIFTLEGGLLTFKDFTDSSYTIPISVKYLNGYNISSFYLKGSDITFNNILTIDGTLKLPEFPSTPMEIIPSRAVWIDSSTGKLIVGIDGDRTVTFFPDGGSIPVSGFDFIISDITQLDSTNTSDLTGGGEVRIVQNLDMSNSSNNIIDLSNSNVPLKISGMIDISGDNVHYLKLRNGTFIIENVRFRGSGFILQLDGAIVIIKDSYNNTNLIIEQNGASSTLKLENVVANNIRISNIDNVEITNSNFYLEQWGGNGSFPFLTNCKNIKLENVNIIRNEGMDITIPIIDYTTPLTTTDIVNIEMNDVKYQINNIVSIIDNSNYNLFLNLTNFSDVNNPPTINIKFDGLVIDYITPCANINTPYAPIVLGDSSSTSTKWTILSENYYIYMDIGNGSENLGMFKIGGDILRGGRSDNAPTDGDSDFISGATNFHGQGVFIKNIFGGAPINTYDIDPTFTSGHNTEIWIGNVYISKSLFT